MPRQSSLPALVPLVTVGLLLILWVAGGGGELFLPAALGLAYALAMLLWLGPALLEQWPGSRPGTIWPDLAVLGLTAWYLLAASFPVSPSRAAAGAVAALVVLVLYFLGRYLGALWVPGREATGWGPLVWAAALLAGLGLVLHALGLTPAAGWPGTPPLTALGDLMVPAPSGYLAGPRVPAGLAPTGRLAVLLYYPNAAGALFLAGLMGAVWSLARAWRRTDEEPGGDCPWCARGWPATPGALTLAGFLLLAGLLLSFSRSAWMLWPVGLVALGLLLPRDEAPLALLAGALLWALGLVFVVIYLPALAAGGPAAGLAVVVAAGALAWLAGHRLGPRLRAQTRPWSPAAAVAALAALTALAGLILPRGAALRLAWPLVTAGELTAWVGRLQDGVAAILGHPLLGVGPGGWTVVAPAFRQAAYVSLEPQNLFLKIGVESGLPGLILLLTVTGGTLAVLAPAAGRRHHGGLNAAYVATGLLVFHALLDYAVGYPPLAAYFFLLLGLTWGLGLRAELGSERKAGAPPARPLRWWWAAATSLAALLVLLAVGVTGRVFEAVGEARLAAARPVAARPAFDWAARLNPLSARAFWGLARAHLGELSPDAVDEALPVLAAAGQTLRLDPGNPVYQSFAGQITTLFGFRDIGLRALDRARELDPVTRDHWENLVWGHARAGREYEEAGDRGRAETAYERAVAWAAATTAYFGPVEQGRANLGLGIAHLRLEKPEAARAAFTRALADPRTAAEAAAWLERMQVNQ